MSKRKRDDESGTPDLTSTPTLDRAESANLLPKIHSGLPAGATVHLRPLITVDKNNKINGIQVGGRTPSPFGGRMGDHTVSWQALVDAAHASLYGCTMRQALTALENMHEAAAAWMSQPGSPGRVMLRQLGGDIPARRALLEDSSYRTGQELSEADIAVKRRNTAKARDHLALALAYHLTYLNYLPFATVRAESDRGSHGSGEGTYRKRLTNFEKGTQLGERSLQEALWALFDFKAVLRESHIRYVLSPSTAEAAITDTAELRQFYATIVDVSAGLAASSRLTRKGSAALGLIVGAASAIHAENLSLHPVIARTAGRVRDDAQAILYAQAERAAMRAGWFNPTTDAGRRRRAALRQELRLAESAAEEAELSLTAAPARAATILAGLLHKHQRTVATAYPHSVRACRFLDPSPVEAALARLDLALAMDPEFGGPALSDQGHTAITDLAERIRGIYAEFGTVAIAESSGWAVAAGHEPLVVSYTQNPREGNRKLSVNGRADAPTGVQGQGSHVTAWVLETRAIEALVAEAASPRKACDALSTALCEDLARRGAGRRGAGRRRETDGVLGLDQFLPAAQLVPGQLTRLFQVAADCLHSAAEANASRTAACFLRYRNLLPFAVVDAGDRGGHGEGSSATAAGFFDRESLEHAIELLTADLLNDARRARASDALKQAATLLNAEISAKDTEDEGGWPTEVLNAARLSVDRLTKRAADLSMALMADDAENQKLDRSARVAAAAAARRKAREDAAAMAEQVRDRRWKEHERVFMALDTHYVPAPYPEDPESAGDTRRR